MKIIIRIFLYFIYIVGIFSQNVYSNTNINTYINEDKYNTHISSTNETYQHGFTNYGTLKYAKSFMHFDYVNPNAPKQGNITLSLGRSLFDKFNPFTLKGEAAPAIAMLMFDTLGVGSMDEEGSIYGLIADGIKVEKYNINNKTITKIIFHINKKAKFNNGDNITAHDVKFSYETLIKEGSPTFAFLYADIKKCNIIDDYTLSFELEKSNNEMPILLSGLPVFSQKWLINKNNKKLKFSELTFEMPIASSPYLIDKYYGGRTITYKLNHNYWAKNHQTRKGMFNFNSITFESYQDDTAMLEAFKSGNFDALVEYRAKNWAKAYTGKLFKQNILIKKEFMQKNGNGMQGFIFNMRRPIFKDINVRKALNLALDFEWMNKQLFYNSYTRIDSYFTNTNFAAKLGIKNILPLEQIYLDEAGVDRNLYQQDFILSNTNAPNSLRNNLMLAQNLFKKAGWEYKNGALRDKNNQAFTFEILDSSGSLSRVISAYVRNLEKLGIRVIQRTIDPAIYQKRLEKFDFDMISLRLPDTNLPGNELVERFSSKSAVTLGSDNLIGVNDKAVDNLLNYITSSKTKEELTASVRALDRVLLHNYYVVPPWYSKYHRIAYRNTLAYPKTLPLYYGGEGWIISTWWNENLLLLK